MCAEWKDYFDNWTEVCAENGQYVTRDDRKFFVVHITAQNSKSLHPIAFLIHGLGGRSEQWNLVFKSLLQAGYDVVIPDLIGHARSMKPNRPDWYTTEELILDVEFLMKQYGPRDEVILVGHSMGAALCAHVCARNINTVQKLALLGTGPTTPASTKSLLWRCCSSRFLTWIRPVISRAARGMFYHPLTDPKFVEAQDVIGKQTPIHVIQHLCNGLVWPMPAVFSRISQPVLVIGADCDRIFAATQLEPMCALMRNANGVTKRIVNYAGHNFQLEHPTIVSEHIIAFLSKK